MIIFVATTVNYCKDCIGKLLRLPWIVAIETGTVVPQETQTDIIEAGGRLVGVLPRPRLASLNRDL
jgi:hypothetical protein